MCTVSWVHHDDGYDLLCNRDEKRTRLPAAGPVHAVRDGVRYVAPVDGDAGGAWIGTNEFGLSACLLNGTGRGPSQRTKSRGLLLPDLLRAESVREAGERIWSLDLTPFAPFVLAVLEPGVPTAVVDWNGKEKSIVPHGEPYMPLISSSFDPVGASLRRREEFRRKLHAAGRLDSNVLFSFHESHGTAPCAYSPCMHRSDAETVSFSWVRVTESAAEFFYTSAAPCKWAPGQSVTLALRQ